MSLVFSITRVLTQGLSGPELSPASVLTQGYPQPLKAPVARNTSAIPVVAAGTKIQPGSGRVAVVQDTPSQIYDASGQIVLRASPIPTVDLGSGQTLTFDPISAMGSILPALSPTPGMILENGQQVYTGSDCKVMIEIV